jgi:hypothetical protein
VNQSAATEGTPRKRVSWVELYFDLIFVFAVGQIAPCDRRACALARRHVRLRRLHHVVLYNRQGDDKKVSHRVVVLLGTIPCAVAATQVHWIFDDGQVLGYCPALASTRFLLAGVYLLTAGIALLGRFASAPVVVAITAAWAVLAAVVVTVLRRRMAAQLGDDPLAFLTG